MAYKEQIPEQNIFKKNTEYYNLQYEGCCTCSYCIKNTQAPTVTFKNFRKINNTFSDLVPLNNYNDKYAFVEYLDNLIPSGQFTYELDFTPFKYENWNSPDIKKTNYLPYNFTYIPFKNCSGSPSSIFGGVNYGPYLGFPFGLWDSLLNAYEARPYNNYFKYYQFPLDYIYNPYNIYLNQQEYDLYNKSGRIFHTLVNACNTEVQKIPVYTVGCPDPYYWTPYYPPCPQSVLECVFGDTITNVFPEKPSQPLDINIPGVYGLKSYMESNDFSFGIKASNNCENNLVKILDLIPLMNINDYLPHTYQDYNLYEKQLFYTPGSVQLVDSSEFIKSGFVLSNLNFNFTDISSSISQSGKPTNYNFNCYFSSMRVINYFLDIFYCPESDWEQLNPYPPIEGALVANCIGISEKTHTDKASCFSSLPNPWVGCTYYQNNWFLGNDSVFNYEGGDFYLKGSETIYNDVFYETYPTSFSLKYNNGVPYDYGLNCHFGNYYSYRPTISYYPNYYYINNGVLDLSSNFAFVDSKRITSQTDSSGQTTLTMWGSKFSGATYGIFKYKYKSEQNRPVLANNSKPAYYIDAYIALGFECDIEIKFQSKPLCNIKDIPSKINSIEEFKVKFENYRKVPQYNTSTRDAIKWMVDQNSYDLGIFGNSWIGNNYNFLLDDNPTYSFENIVYAPPTQNINNFFYINRNGLVKNIQDIEEPMIEDFTSSCYGVNYNPYPSKTFNYNGRIYDDKQYTDEYKSCLLVTGDETVWQTGNEITITTKSSEFAVPESLKPIKIGNNNRKYYCIFIKKISENYQNVGMTLIRLADTYQKSIDEEYIKIENYMKYYGTAYFDINVKYERYKRDEAKYLAPKYQNFNYQNFDKSNSMLDKYSIPYQIVTNPTSSYQDLPNGELFLNSIWNGSSFFFSFRPDGLINSISTPLVYDFKNPFNVDVISMSPLKIIFKNVIFRTDNYSYDFSKLSYLYNYETYYKVFDPSVGYPYQPKTTYNCTSKLSFGFMCDILFEENLKGDNKYQLPIEFNSILDMDQYIQTSGVYNSKSPLKMINPEKCTHIGKVIDRKDCNCPKKWIRQCEIHETTDWKKCMSCPNYQPED